jgi:hypothetical protein
MKKVKVRIKKEKTDNPSKLDKNSSSTKLIGTRPKDRK